MLSQKRHSELVHSILRIPKSYVVFLRENENMKQSALDGQVDVIELMRQPYRVQTTLDL